MQSMCNNWNHLLVITRHISYTTTQTSKFPLVCSLATTPEHRDRPCHIPAKEHHPLNGWYIEIAVDIRGI